MKLLPKAEDILKSIKVDNCYHYPELNQLIELAMKEYARQVLDYAAEKTYLTNDVAKYNEITKIKDAL
jgi:hypothetical protein